MSDRTPSFRLVALLGLFVACSESDTTGSDPSTLGTADAIPTNSPSDSPSGANTPVPSGSPMGTSATMPTEGATPTGGMMPTSSATATASATNTAAPTPSSTGTMMETGGSGGAAPDGGGSGGENVAGSSGMGTGGAAGATGASGAPATGGGAGDDAGPSQSVGCGAETWPENGRYTVQSSGMAREYVLDVPTDYDPNNPYRLFFTWHWRGGNSNDVVNGAGEASRGPYYGLKQRSNGSAIFVSPEGLVDNGVTGWANPNGRDIQFLRDMLDQINAELCIDQQRIFSTGFSYGGMMSHAVGCAMGDVFRAIAPMAGAQFSGCEDGDAPVAFWGSHAPGDGVVGIDLGRQGKDEFVQRNGCSMTTTPVEPSGCVSHEGCQEGYPVIWCEFSGDHFTPDFAPDATWEFFSQF